MAKRNCGPKKPCGKPQGIYNPFFTGAPFYGSGGASTISPYTERVIKAGSGPQPAAGYWAFGESAIDSNGREHHFWIKGPDHNTSVAADAVYFFKNYNSDTLSSEVVLKAAVGGSTRITNTWALVGANDRVLMGWTELISGASVMKYKYSDNAATVSAAADATWTEVALPTTYPMDGPGGALYLGSNVIVKYSYVNSGPNNNYIFLWRSADNGTSFAANPHGTISSDTVTPNDETGLVQLSDGRLMAFMRCNHATKRIIRTCKSTDSGITAGATWGPILDTTVPAYGKPGVCITPQNQIVGICREYLNEAFSSNRTIYFYTKPESWDTYTYGFIDNRTASFMYGKPNYSAVEGKVIASYAVEGLNSTTHQGPNIIVRKELVISASAQTNPNTGIDPMLQNVLDFAQGNNETLPDTTLKTKLNTWFTNLRAGGYLTSMDYIRPCLNDATLSAIRDRNWFQPWEQVTVVNSPTYTAPGYSLNGTTQRIDLGTGARLNGFTSYARDNAGAYYYTPTTAQDAAFGRSFGMTILQLIIRASDGNLYYRINDATNTTVVNAAGGGRYFLQRPDASTKKAWKNGTQIQSASVASLTLVGVSDNVNVGCLNAGAGSFTNFRAEVESMLILSAAFTGNEAAYDEINRQYLVSIGL